MVKYQRKPASGTADPHVQAPTILQPDVIHTDHAAILA